MALLSRINSGMGAFVCLDVSLAFVNVLIIGGWLGCDVVCRMTVGAKEGSIFGCGVTMACSSEPQALQNSEWSKF
jgi:hypothetical protein